MDNVVLTARWINSSLEKLATAPNLSYDQSAALFEALTESTIKKIHNKVELSASEFLLACIAHFIFYDLKDKKYCLPTDLHERNRGVMYYRPLYYLDIEEAKECFNVLFSNFLKQLSSHCDLNEKKNVLFLFELVDRLQGAGQLDRYIEKYRTVYIFSKGKPRMIAGKKQNIGSFDLIPDEFIQHIFYDHYGLDHNIAKDGLPLVNRYNAEEAAQKLGVSKHNLIKACLDTSLGAYINSGQFKIQRCTSGNQYNKEIIEAFADVTYPYKYYGLARLSKPMLKVLYSEEITTNDKTYSLINLQPSLAEVIQTLSLYIDLRGNQRITIDDLLFVEDEILALQSTLAKTTKAEATAIADDGIGSVERPTSHQDQTKERQSQQKQPNRLLLLIQKKLMESEDKRAVVIWGEIRKNGYIWIDKVDPWGNGREEATIKWGTPSVTDKTMKRAAFETYVSQLNTGTKSFSKECYDNLYED